MTTYYLLEHRHQFADGAVNMKLIGIYSSLANAKAALTEVRDQPGFRDSPESFRIFPRLLDETNWRQPEPILVSGDPETAGAGLAGRPGTPLHLIWQELEDADGREEIRLVGIYSSEAKAEAALAEVRRQPEFRDHPESLAIYGDALDEIDWREGYVTLAPDET